MRKTWLPGAIAALALTLAAAPALAALPVKMGETRAQVPGAVSAPGQTVALRVWEVKPIGNDDATWRSQLVISGPGGKPAWTGPRATSGPLAFQGGPGGEETLMAAGPFERAGEGAVILAEAQSDVRVPRLRVLRWNGRGLALVRSQCLTEWPVKSGRFVWGDNQTPRGRWVGRVERILAPGRCAVALAAAKADGSTTETPAVLVADGDGFKLAR